MDFKLWFNNVICGSAVFLTGFLMAFAVHDSFTGTLVAIGRDLISIMVVLVLSWIGLKVYLSKFGDRIKGFFGFAKRYQVTIVAIDEEAPLTLEGIIF